MQQIVFPDEFCIKCLAKAFKTKETETITEFILSKVGTVYHHPLHLSTVCEHLETNQTSCYSFGSLI